jgi:hypothetical protein
MKLCRLLDGHIKCWALRFLCGLQPGTPQSIFVEKFMWPGSSPSAVVNGAAGMIIAALVVVALYAGRDLFMPLAQISAHTMKSAS